MDKFEDVKKEVLEIISKAKNKEDLHHSQLVLKWVLKLRPDADEALKISALSHDIERAITGMSERDLKDYSKINEYKREHALRV
jgi:hypothetical protein